MLFIPYVTVKYKFTRTQSMEWDRGNYSILKFLVCFIQVGDDVIIHTVNSKAIMKNTFNTKIIKIIHKRKQNTKTNAIHSREVRKGGTVERRIHEWNIKQTGTWKS